MATKELTTGNPYKLLLFFMFPIFLGNVFQQVYHLTDTLIVGRIIGLKALAATGVTAPLIFLVISFIFASTQGFTIITAQKFGAGEHHLVRKSFAASVILSAILSVIMTAISTPFSYKLLALLRTPDDIINLAASYLVIMFGGIFATIFYNLSANVIRALGDSKTPLYFLIVSAFLNIFMDLLFIIKFKLGIQGAGYATVVAQAISTLLCVTYMFIKFPVLRLKKEDWKTDWRFLYEHLKVGIPMGFQMSILSLGMIAIQFVLNTFGSTAVAAFTTAVRVDQLFSQAYIALGATLAVFTAQNFGAKKWTRIKDGAKAGVVIAIWISLFSAIIISLYSRPMISVFLNEINEEVIRLAQIYLYIVIIFFIFLGLLMIFRNVLQGMGEVMAPLWSGVGELVARTICAFVLGYYFGYKGICFAGPAAWIAATIILYFAYKIKLKNSVKKFF
ncbi:MAG: MATE family efflux transporter [bacterium]|nr:MATE family efflux transporter [bacterium]